MHKANSYLLMSLLLLVIVSNSFGFLSFQSIKKTEAPSETKEKQKIENIISVPEYLQKNYTSSQTDICLKKCIYGTCSSSRTSACLKNSTLKNYTSSQTLSCYKKCMLGNYSSYKIKKEGWKWEFANYTANIQTNFGQKAGTTYSSKNQLSANLSVSDGYMGIPNASPLLMPYYELIVNTTLSDNNNSLDSIKTNMLSLEGGLINLTLSRLLGITRYINGEPSGGFYLQPFGMTKYVQGATVNNVKVDNFAQFQEGVAFVMHFGTYDSSEKKSGTGIITFPLTFSQINKNTMSQLYGSNSKYDFITTSILAKIYIVNKVAFSIDSTLTNSNNAIGKNTVFSFNYDFK